MMSSKCGMRLLDVNRKQVVQQQTATNEMILCITKNHDPA